MNQLEAADFGTMRELTMKILNQDFDLNTFYWHYCKAEAGNIIYTVECFDTSKGQMKATFTPFMTITAIVDENHDYQVHDLSEGTVESRILEALKQHFTWAYLIKDGHMMLAEYVSGASGELHKSPEHGQAIFGCDLEEAYADAN